MQGNSLTKPALAAVAAAALCLMTTACIPIIAGAAAGAIVASSVSPADEPESEVTLLGRSLDDAYEIALLAAEDAAEYRLASRDDGRRELRLIPSSGPGSLLVLLLEVSDGVRVSVVMEGQGRELERARTAFIRAVRDRAAGTR